MKFRFNIVFQPIGDFYLAVPVGAEASDCAQYIKLNEVGYFIASRIDRGLSREQIVDELTEEYDIDTPTAQASVDASIQSFLQIGFLE